MSALTDKIVAEHMPTRTSACTCGGMQLGEYYPRHIAEVTEAAVREQVARDIEEAEVWAVRTDLLDRWGTSLGGRRTMSPHRAHMIVQLVRADAARIAEGEQ